jgi:peroxiredoxin
MSFDPLEYRRRTIKSGRRNFALLSDLNSSVAELETWNLKLETFTYARISH